jgi:hypothetical protein
VKRVDFGERVQKKLEILATLCPLYSTIADEGINLVDNILRL